MAAQAAACSHAKPRTSTGTIPGGAASSTRPVAMALTIHSAEMGRSTW
jgi:hypothetical protein